MRNIRYLLEKYVRDDDTRLAPVTIEQDRVRVYPLTPETKAQIVALSQKGMMPTKIAAKVGRSVTAVRNVIKLARQAAQRSSAQSPRTDPQSSRKPGFPQLRQVKGVRPSPPRR